MNDSAPAATKIRLATDGDGEVVFGLMSALGYTGLSLSNFLEVYQALTKDTTVTLLVAEVDLRIVGLASVSRRPQLRLGGDIVTVDELVVSPEWRGRGVGRVLLEQVNSMARQAGCRRLELLTSRSRESYRREFYIKNGFTEADSAVMRIEYGPDGD